MGIKDWDWAKAHKDVPELPADFREYALDLFDGDHTLYYYGRGVNQTVICPVCRHAERYGSRTRIYPKSGERALCISCGRRGEYRHALRTERPSVNEIYIFIGQKYGEKGFILRGFKATLTERSPLSKQVQYKDEEPFEIRLSEHRRLYITRDGYEKEYNDPKWETLHRTASGYPTAWAEDEFSIRWGAAYGDNYKKFIIHLYPGIIEEMKGTAAEYSMMQSLYGPEPQAEYYLPIPKFSYAGCVDLTIWDFLVSYAKDRKLEILFKCGLTNLAISKLAGEPLHYNWRGKTPWDYLKVTKERFKWMCKHNPSTRMLEICRYERKHGLRLDEESCNTFGASGMTAAELDYYIRFMSPKQLSNRLLKYTGKKGDLRQIHITYRDYLHMREALEYNMNDSIIVYPRNLREEHDKMVIEQNANEAAKRQKEAEKKFRKIRERFKGAAGVYMFEEKGLMIRIAKNASEIVEEGRQLHHCVGGDTYLKRHADRKSAILFIRHAKDPTVPYITVEIAPTGEIKQWYGIHDTKPDKKKIEKFLKDYQKQLDLKALAKEAKVKICATERVAV